MQPCKCFRRSSIQKLSWSVAELWNYNEMRVCYVPEETPGSDWGSLMTVSEYDVYIHYILDILNTECLREK